MPPLGPFLAPDTPPPSLLHSELSPISLLTAGPPTPLQWSPRHLDSPLSEVFFMSLTSVPNGFVFSGLDNVFLQQHLQDC